jgi:hypothetical protein
LEDEFDEDDVDLDAEGVVVWGVIVDWLFLVEVGTPEPVPVTSGESVTGLRVKW